MTDHTGIEWTDATWNPIRGCSRVSQGCVNCYAERIAARFSGPGQPYEGLARMVDGAPRWSGDVRALEGATLTQPLRWKRPRRIFVNSMSDLFHEKLPAAAVDRIFAVMALCPQHTFQVLTKRGERMREYCSAPDLHARIDAAMNEIAPAHWCTRELDDAGGLPLRNVWLGVSAENQERWDDQVSHLGATPAALRFVSVEPMLEHIDVGNAFDAPGAGDEYQPVAWVICGGESGEGARPMHPTWPAALRDDCKRAGVPFFFKQWGEWHPAAQHNPDQTKCEGTPRALNTDGQQEGRPHVAFSLIGHVEGWAGMCRLGKRMAGRALEGVEHSEFPTLPARAEP